MSEYIERDYLLKRVHDVVFSYKPPRIPKGEAEHIIKMFLIEEAPAADVARVVRCKDCCYWNRKYTTVGECEKLADRDQEGGAQFDCDMDDDDFCSYGKRKENT